MRALLVTDEPSPTPLSLTADDLALVGREAGREALNQAAACGLSVFGDVHGELRSVRAERPSDSPKLLTFRAFEKALIAQGVELEVAALASDGLYPFDLKAFDVVLVDVNRVHPLDGQLAAGLRAATRTPVLVLSRNRSAIGETVIKPVTVEALIDRMDAAIGLFAQNGFGRKGVAVA